MPFTVIILVSRKPTLSLPAFKHHWETAHIPLLRSIAGEDFPLSHTRHYIERDLSQPSLPANIIVGTQEDFSFDAIAVLTFMNEAHWKRFIGKCSEASAAKTVAEDDERFQDHAKMKAVFVGGSMSTGRDGKDVGWRFIGSM